MVGRLPRSDTSRLRHAKVRPAADYANSQAAAAGDQRTKSPHGLGGSMHGLMHATESKSSLRDESMPQLQGLRLQMRRRLVNGE